MTTSPAETATRPPTHKIDLSPTKVLASALAAISTAVAASYLGAMGTIIGAGVGSILASVTTAIYQLSLHRTRDKLKQVVPLTNVVIRQRANAHPEDADPADVPDVGQDHPGHDPDKTSVMEISPGARGTAAVPVTPVRDTTAGENTGGLPDVLRRIRWGRVLAAAAVIFVVSFGSLMIYETVIGKSVSDAVQGKESHGGGTIPEIFTRQSPEPETTPSQAPSAEPSSDESPAATPSGEATPPAEESGNPAATANPVDPAPATQPSGSDQKPAPPLQPTPGNAGQGLATPSPEAP